VADWSGGMSAGWTAAGLNVSQLVAQVRCLCICFVALVDALDVKINVLLLLYFIIIIFWFLGKKNFLSPSHLIYGFGFLFKVSLFRE